MCGPFAAQAPAKQPGDVSGYHNSCAEALEAVKAARNDDEVATAIHDYLKVKQRHMLRRNDYRPPPEVDRFKYFTEKLNKLMKAIERNCDANKVKLCKARMLAIRCAYYENLRQKDAIKYATLDPLLGVPQDVVAMTQALVSGKGGERESALPLTWQGSLQKRASF